LYWHAICLLVNHVTLAEKKREYSAVDFFVSGTGIQRPEDQAGELRMTGQTMKGNKHISS
jgi:hypothetical protein